MKAVPLSGHTKRIKIRDALEIDDQTPLAGRFVLEDVEEGLIRRVRIEEDSCFCIRGRRAAAALAAELRRDFITR